MTYTESELEQVAVGWFGQLGYELVEPEHGAPGAVYDERDAMEEPWLRGRLVEALRRLNPEASEELLAEGERRLRRVEGPALLQRNAAMHRLLVDGIEVEVRREDGRLGGERLRVIDFERPDDNDWVIARQVEVVDRRHGTGQLRRADLVVYVNGLPLAVLELKNPAGAATVWDAHQQLVTYQQDIPALFTANVALVVADDVDARVGALGAEASRFLPWKAVSDEKDRPATMGPFETLVRGVFERGRFLDLTRGFVVFEAERDRLEKKLAAYHQFHAVRRAVAATVKASGEGGSRRAGVVWHTQGSGKSLTMVFYAGKLAVEPAMANPTLVVITDRNDLDDQLFGTFARCASLLRQAPEQAQDRDDLRQKLRREAGGVVFTTMQKFLAGAGERFPVLSERRNVVVIADEAHRTQYGFKARVSESKGTVVYGFAKHLRDALPGATFLGFTGTPVELDDKNTRSVFGDYVSVYDVQRAVEDGATVPIYYESRLSKLGLDAGEEARLDESFEEVTEGEEEEQKEALKSEWSSLEALVGTPKRLRQVARDLVAHLEARGRDQQGKAMVVCMSRRICADLYAQIRALRPGWHDDEDDQGAMKVVITGSASDKPGLLPHVRSKARRDLVARRFKDPSDPLKLVIVRDMWLTGFDVPCLHTLYVDKPMRGHSLMQAIARVNRVFGDKPGGLVVDYLGIGAFLREAMQAYSRGGGEGEVGVDQDEAVRLMGEKLEVALELLHGVDVEAFFEGTPGERLALLAAARNHVLGLQGGQKDGRGRDGYERFLEAVAALGKAFALAMPHPACDEVRERVAFVQAVRVGLVKLATGQKPPDGRLEHAVRQIVDSALVPQGVVDVFEAAGVRKPDVSVLSPEFLAEVAGMKHQNLAAAVLKRLLQDEVRARGKRSVVQGRKFSEMLRRALLRYEGRSVETKEVIEELLEIARTMREAQARGEALGLSREEEAFYEALADNESATQVMGDQQLASLAGHLTQIVREGATIDWSRKEQVQAQLKVKIKRLLRQHGFPPDAQERATALVLEQAKLLGINLVEGGEPPPASAPGGGRGPSPLPYPFAAFDHLVQCHVTALERVRMRLDGFERGFAFLALLALALRRGPAGFSDEAKKLLAKELGKPVSMGTWLELAWRLAALEPASAAPAVRALRSLVNDKGKPSELTKELQSEVVPQRNKLGHSTLPDEVVLADLEAALEERWTKLEAAVAPLRQTRLVSLARIDGFKPGDLVRYQLRDHQGYHNPFPIVALELPARLLEGWAYLIQPGAAPLLLSPGLWCGYSPQTQLRELFYPRTLALTAGETVELLGLTSGSSCKQPIALGLLDTG